MEEYIRACYVSSYVSCAVSNAHAIVQEYTTRGSSYGHEQGHESEADIVSGCVHASNDAVDEWQRKAQNEISESEGKLVRRVGGGGDSKKFEPLS